MKVYTKNSPNRAVQQSDIQHKFRLKISCIILPTNAGLGALYGPLHPQMQPTSVHRMVLNSFLLLLRWRYSPGWTLAPFTIRLQASRSLALSLHSFIPISLRSVDTSSSHLTFCLPFVLLHTAFPYIFFFLNYGYCKFRGHKFDEERSPAR